MLTYKDFIEGCERVKFDTVEETEEAKIFKVVVRTPAGLWSQKETFSKELLSDLGETFARNESTFLAIKAAYNKYVIDLAQS